MENREALTIFRTIQKCRHQALHTNDCGNCERCQYYLEQEQIDGAVTMAISALEKQEQDRWIPVTERLPEIGEYVLCQLPHAQSFGGGKIQVCKYCAPDKYRDKPYFDHFRDGFPNVLAWRPLPEPYQEEEDE